MNSKAKRRLGVATGAIVIALIVVLAVVGGNSAARTVSIAEASEIGSDAKIQVTGNVVEHSFSIEGNVLTFSMYDPDADPSASQPLAVRYDGGVSATFGNDVTAICTGRMDKKGFLECQELVTKCPSKYDNATDALTVTSLLGYGDKVVDKPVKVAGTVAGNPGNVEADKRFELVDEEGARMPVRFLRALSDEIAEGTRVVLTGSLGGDGSFTATNVALEG